MKKLLVFLVSLFVSFSVFAQEKSEEKSDDSGVKTEVQSVTEIVDDDDDEIPFNNSKRVFFIFNQGASYLNVTRIQKAKQAAFHSNYIWNNSMVGVYSSVQTENFPVSDWYFRYQVLYPFKYQFNGMETFAKQTILYAVDFFFGMPFQFKGWKYVNIDFTPGLHGMYQLSDEYHLGYFGAGVMTGLEFPISSRWTILTDGTFTFDYANLGSNKNIQRFDYSWTWQASFGFRYSRKHLNTYSYLGKKEKAKARQEALSVLNNE